MKPNLDEMRLAVARMLPNAINCNPWSSLQDSYFYTWRETDVEITPFEWLYAAWLAEKTLTQPECTEYMQILDLMTSRQPDEWEAEGKPAAALYGTHSGVLRRIEALCRVRCPEMFTEETNE